MLSVNANNIGALGMGDNLRQGLSNRLPIGSLPWSFGVLAGLPTNAPPDFYILLAYINSPRLTRNNPTLNVSL